MRVVVATEGRLLRTPDGRTWTLGVENDSFWRRYLVVFDQVRIVARVRDVTEAPPGASRVAGGPVEVHPVAHYIGPEQFLRRLAAIRRSARQAVGDGDAVILRVPSQLATVLLTCLPRGRPYAVEVLGDPYDSLAPGTVRHPLRPLFRKWSVNQITRQCRSAAAVAYVTGGFLQGRYPAGPAAATWACSDIDLRAADLVAVPRAVRRPPPVPTLVSVGTLEVMYKGIDTLLEAIARQLAEGTTLRLFHAGDGRCLPRLRRTAARLGIADQVRFLGQVPPDHRLRALLDAADVFVMPSRQEGLPRALVQAMARGLPAIGSTAGGIPELLPADCLVPPNDPVALGAAVSRLLQDPLRMSAESARNLARAAGFVTDALAPARTAFYQAVQQATATANR